MVVCGTACSSGRYQKNVQKKFMSVVNVSLSINVVLFWLISGFLTCTCIYIHRYASACIDMYLHVSTCIYMHTYVSTCAFLQKLTEEVLLLFLFKFEQFVNSKIVCRLYFSTKTQKLSLFLRHFMLNCLISLLLACYVTSSHG